VPDKASATDCRLLFVCLCSFVGKDAQVNVPVGGANGPHSHDMYSHSYFAPRYFDSDSEESSSSDSYLNGGLHDDDDDDDDDGRITETVVPKSQTKYRLVAYILPRDKHPDATGNLIVYTSGSALPLLVSIKPKWAKGKVFAYYLAVMSTACTRCVFVLCIQAALSKPHLKICPSHVKSQYVKLNKMASLYKVT